MKYYFSIASIFLVSWVFAQNNINYWYFGQNAGIVFDSTGVAGAYGQMSTKEGCTAISDGCGLQFYTDGDTVWTKNHSIMANGFGLGGQCTAAFRQSATQSSIVVRQPQNDSLFYVFTTDCHEDDLLNGLRYSIINMAKQNGEGEVILKNQFLHAPVGEKVTAVKHENGCDIWIVTHEYGTNGFYSFLLTDVGLDELPVISYTGQAHSGDPEYDNCVRGYLKASPNGEKLISVTPDGVYWYCDTILPELFSFNKATGTVISDFVLPGDTSISDYYSSWAIPFYGATFSPDNSKLYVSSGFYGPHLFQYDLNAGTPIDIINSKTSLNTPTFALPKPCAMQIGPDGKIYVAQQWKGYLGAINNPDSAGLACNYVDSAVVLLPSTLQDWGGLPNFFEAYTIPSPLTASFNHTTPILNETTSFYDTSIGADSFLWDFGDSSTSTVQDPNHIYNEPGTYTVTLTAKDSLCNIDKYCVTIEIEDPNDIHDFASELPSVTIYPNPFSNSTRVELANVDDTEIYLYALAGEYARHIETQNSRNFSIELGSELPPGIYLLTIITSKTVLTKKLMKLR